MPHLAVDESHTAGPLAARETLALTGLEVSAGEIYEIGVRVLEPLFDRTIPVPDTRGFATKDTRGLTRLIMWWAESRRRVRDSNWFRLMGTIDHGEDYHFPIGAGGRLEMPATGVLCCFLNDHPRHYDNNRGTYELTFRRLS